MASLRHGGDSLALEPETVDCAGCGCPLGEDEAQAVRWGAWSKGRGDLYPYCEACAADGRVSDSNEQK